MLLKTAVENELIMVNHAEIGKIIAEKWGFPNKLVAAIQHHHAPTLVSGDQLEVHIVHLADYLCHWKGIGKSGSPTVEAPFSGSLRALGLENQETDQIWESLNIKVEEMVSML